MKQSILHGCALGVITLSALVWTVDPSNVLHFGNVQGHAIYSASVDCTGTYPDGMHFNPCAEIDTSHTEHVTEPGTKVLMPEGYNPETTPTVLFNGVWIPDESPDGGYPTQWLDNSPAYSDGWVLLVNDQTHTVRWHAPEKNYGAGAGAVCGTDAQCAGYSRNHNEAPSGYAKDK